MFAWRRNTFLYYSCFVHAFENTLQKIGQHLGLSGLSSFYIAQWIYDFALQCLRLPLVDLPVCLSIKKIKQFRAPPPNWWRRYSTAPIYALHHYYDYGPSIVCTKSQKNWPLHSLVRKISELAQPPPSCPGGHTINFEKFEVFYTKDADIRIWRIPSPPCPKNIRTGQPPSHNYGRLLWTAP